MFDGFPVPDFDFGEAPLISTSKPIQFPAQPCVPTELYLKTCLEYGFTINANSPIRCTGNSVVYSAKSVDGGETFALKISSFKARINAEFENRSALPDNLHLVKSFNVFETQKLAILQMELCEMGDLTGKTFTEEQTWQIVHDVGCALSVIHESGWMHLDISPSNILYDGSYFKVADFGTLVKVGEFISGCEGAGPYVSPETMRFSGGDNDRADVGPPTDIFSFGVVLLEVASGFFAPRGGDERYAKLRDGSIRLGGDLYRCGFSQELVSLVNSMLSPDPKCRPSAADVSSHPMAVAASRRRKN